MPKLVVYCKDSHKEYELTSDPVTCGRGASNVIQIADYRASREHCRFQLQDGKWYVVDLESSNGTQFDGRAIVQPEELRNGSVVRIGDVRISYVDEAAPSPQPAPAEPAETGLSLRAAGGPCDGRIFLINKTVTRIGRAADNEIVLEDAAVSSHHAELVVEGPAARIIDKKSRNGVRVNDVHVSERALDDGDSIVIGSTTFEFGAAAQGAQAAESGVEAEPVIPKSSTAMSILAAAAVIAAVLAGAWWFFDYLAASRTDYSAREGNLLVANPSFEKGSDADIPGWTRATGSATLEGNAAEGNLALRLLSASGGGADVSALCWSGEIPVSSGKAYEFSAMVRNSGGESASLCVAWLTNDSERKWLRSLQLGARTDDALEWRQVSETFVPPAWASAARFGCAVVGQGTAKFDALFLREAGAAPQSSRLSAGRIFFETASRGEWTAFAAGKPLVTRGRVVVTSGGRLAVQSLGTLEKGYPQTGPRMAKFVGTLGLDAKFPFTEVVSTDGNEVTIHHEVQLTGSAGELFTVEFQSDPAVLADGVTLESSNRGSSVEKAPFAGRTDITTVTFFSGSKRVFLKLSQPASLTVSGEPGEALAWRLEFPHSWPGNRPAVQLVWGAADPEKTAKVAAELRAAIMAEEDEELGKAARAYEEFIERHRLYSEEAAEAGRRLKSLKADITLRIDRAGALAVRARRSQLEADYIAAESALKSLIEKLKGDPRVDQLSKAVADLKADYAAVTEKNRAREASVRLAKAKAHIAARELIIARAVLVDLIKKYEGTQAAEEARSLLATLPQPEM